MKRRVRSVGFCERMLLDEEGDNGVGKTFFDV
jgi:hypothetical protein